MPIVAARKKYCIQVSNHREILPMAAIYWNPQIRHFVDVATGARTPCAVEAVDSFAACFGSRIHNDRLGLEKEKMPSKGWYESIKWIGWYGQAPIKASLASIRMLKKAIQAGDGVIACSAGNGLRGLRQRRMRVFSKDEDNVPMVDCIVAFLRHAPITLYEIQTDGSYTQITAFMINQIFSFPVVSSPPTQNFIWLLDPSVFGISFRSKMMATCLSSDVSWQIHFLSNNLTKANSSHRAWKNTGKLRSVADRSKRRAINKPVS
jgi:hypothetical protein